MAQISVSNASGRLPCSFELSRHWPFTRWAPVMVVWVLRVRGATMAATMDVIRGAPTNLGVGGVGSNLPGAIVLLKSSFAIRPCQAAAQPLWHQACTSDSKAGLFAVKYWAPWSACHSSVRRVLIRPDAPRLFSKSVTARPALCRATDADAPAMPAPMTATRLWALAWLLAMPKAKRRWRAKSSSGCYQLPTLGIEAQGSAGGSGSPRCRSSIEISSGERTKAIRPSRGGRLITTPACMSRSQVS